MKTPGKNTIAVIAQAMIAATVWVGCTRQDAPRGAPPPASSGPRTNGGAVGRQRRWALVFDVRLAQPDHQEPVQVQITGDWLTTVSAVRDGELDVACEVIGARVTGNSSPSSSEMEALRRRLERRFWVTYRADGMALRIHFPRDMDPSDRNLLQMIPTETQLVRPAGASTKWTALEQDAAGRYLALYQHVGSDPIEKRKLKYVEVDGSASPGGARSLEIKIDGSERRYVLDGNGGILSFGGGDRIRIGAPLGEGGWIEIQNTIKLSLPRDGMALELGGSLERARAGVDSSPIVTHRVDPGVLRTERDRRLLAGHTTDALLTAAQSAQSNGSEDQLLQPRLAALFRERPGAISPALERIRVGSGTQLLTGGLAGAKTDAALRALDQLAHDHSVAAPIRADALVSLVLVQHPTVETMRIPEDLLDDRETEVRRAARLVLGSLAQSGRGEHSKEAAAIDQALLLRYVKANDLGERQSLLSALGNSVGPTVLPVLASALRDASAEVRAAAVRALRLAEGSDADRQIAGVMLKDEDPGVREAAIFAVGFRSVDPFLDALCRAATEDPIEYVRSNAVSRLAGHLDASPKVREALAHVAEHDPKPRVRRLAREALTRSAAR